MLYNEGLAHGGTEWASNTIRCALLTASYSPDKDHKGWAAVSSYELGAAGGYTTKGGTPGILTSKTTVNDDTNDDYAAGAADVAFGALTTGSIRYAVIFDDTDDLLLRVIDFTTTRTLNGSNVSLLFTNNEIITRAAA